MKKFLLALGGLAVLALTGCSVDGVGSAGDIVAAKATTTAAATDAATDPATDPATDAETDAPALGDTTEPEPEPAPEQTETKAGVGQALTVSQDDTEVAQITLTAADNTRAAPNEFSDPPANGYYVTFTITAKATGSGTWDVNPFDFYVRTADGQHLDPAAGNAFMAAKDDSLNAVTLNPGETVKGTITLDVPAPHGDLVYAPFTRAIGSWGY